MKLSLCMIVKNEELTLDRCLSSVSDFVDEIIIVDTGSTDSTKEIAKKYNAKIYDFEWVNDFSKARNFSFSKATGDYTMWLDGDDYIEENYRIKLEETLKELEYLKIDTVSSEYILSKDEIGNTTYSLRRNRIVKRDRNFKWIGAVHEYLDISSDSPYGLSSNFCVTHGKVKPYTKRNLEIYKEYIKNGNRLSTRDTYYFANELKDNLEFKDAIAMYSSFLLIEGGKWIEDERCAYIKLYECHIALNDPKRAIEVLFDAVGRGFVCPQICCNIAAHYTDDCRSIFWYKNALSAAEFVDDSSLTNKDYLGYIPAIELCVRYYRLGDYKKSNEYNELALSYKPNNEQALSNRKLLQAIIKK